MCLYTLAVAILYYVFILGQKGEVGSPGPKGDQGTIECVRIRTYL